MPHLRKLSFPSSKLVKFDTFLETCSIKLDTTNNTFVSKRYFLLVYSIRSLFFHNSRLTQCRNFQIQKRDRDILSWKKLIQISRRTQKRCSTNFKDDANSGRNEKDKTLQLITTWNYYHPYIFNSVPIYQSKKQTEHNTKRMCWTGYSNI